MPCPHALCVALGLVPPQAATRSSRRRLLVSPTGFARAVATRSSPRSSSATTVRRCRSPLVPLVADAPRLTLLPLVRPIRYRRRQGDPLGAQVGVRDVRLGARHRVRRHGDARGPARQRRLHPHGRPVRRGARRDQQQQLRQRRRHRRRRRAHGRPRRLGRMVRPPSSLTSLAPLLPCAPRAEQPD